LGVTAVPADRVDLELFYDGACPLCSREVAFIRKLDRRNGIKLTDIAAPDFDPVPLGKDFSTLMARIHARTPDGTWLEGVEVFRRIYTAVGLGPLAALSRLPGIAWLAERSYDQFAKNRLRLTGRCDADVCRPASESATRTLS
jgi:predicted DCC family thiol-disulfide oxidoreductase YuxK